MIDTMKKAIPAFAILFIIYTKATAQSSAATLDIVGWNIEWFGATGNGPSDDNLQRENVKKVIRYLDADIYGLTEMVDTVHIRRLVDSLGPNYAYIISPFCSGATAPGNGTWRTGQKLMFLYKKDIFSNVTTRGLLRSSSSAYTNWASGRFPFMLTADVTINGVTKNINFIVIHGKAGATADDYDRRYLGATELKDTLDAQFSNSINIIFGDFNDALNQTISSGSGPFSSFQPIIVDSTDADHYKSITLPLAVAGQTSMLNFPNVVDNHVISNEMVPYYVLNTVQIRTDITNAVPDYVTTQNTSDHWPVFSKYNLSGVITSVPNVSPAELGVIAFPNPVEGPLHLRATKTLSNVSLQLIDMQGQVLGEERIAFMQNGTTIQPKLPLLSRGIYFLKVQTKQYASTIKLMVLK
jgi:hypothetical protein